MAKLTLGDIASTNAGSIVTTFNANNALLEAALENTLSRDGTSPNEMNDDLDMNSNRIYNLPEATADTEPVRFAEFNDYVTTLDAAVAAAQAAATSAASSYDSFDDRYLGAKAAAPTLDNDNNALIEGALYFNSVSNTLFIWNGSAWQATTGGGGGISNVVEDTSPQLGGNLDLNGFTVGAATAADLTKLNAITSTSAELNFTDGVTSAIQTQLDGKQPLDGDLTSIAALTTTAYGRGLLTLADAAALGAEVDSQFLTPAEGNAAYQPLDSDLTAIAALSPSNDDIIQRKGGVWTNRTMAQLATDLDSSFLTPAEGNAAYQPLDADLTAVAALTTTAAGRSVLTVSDDALDEIVVWDDSASTMKTMPLADFTDEAAPAAGDYILIYGAEGDVRKTNWSNLPGVGGGINNVSEDTSPTLGGNLEGNTFSIGTSGSPVADVFLESGGVINFNAGDVTFTHSANTITMAGGSLVLPDAGLTMGASIPFSDSAGTLTLQNVDALDATTESTIEAAIDTLANLVSVQGRTVTLADAGADAIFGWDDSANAYQNLSAADVRTAISGQAQDELLDEIAALSTDPNADSGLFFDDSAGNIAYWTPTNGLEFSGTNLQMTSNIRTRSITFIIDGGGSTITTGVKGYLEIPFACTIDRATALADQSGSIVVDIWKDTYANYPPTDADSITSAAPITISSATKSQDATLTGWTTSVTAGDILGFNVDSITTCQRVTIALRVTLV